LFGEGVIDQTAPFHISASVEPNEDVLPTARQVVVDPHETPARLLLVPLGGLGIDCALHVVPDSDSARTPSLLANPTASHIPETGQEIESRLPIVDPPSDSDQVPEDHDSASSVPLTLPTATHDTAEVHETATSWPSPTDGIVTICHDIPSQLSLKGISEPPLDVSPTAMHHETLVQETASSSVRLAPLGLGVASVVQLDAVQDAANGAPFPTLFGCQPTAMHPPGVQQSTESRVALWPWTLLA